MADREEKRPPGDEIDPDAPPTAEEVAASQRLRDSLERGPRVFAGTGEQTDVPELVESLRAAWSPEEISDSAHQEIIDAVPTADELASAEALRLALEEPSTVTGGDALLAVSLKAAFAPGEISDADHRSIVDAALARMPTSGTPQDPPEAVRPRGATSVLELAARRRGNVVRVTFGVVTGAIALAASIVLVLTWQGSHGDANGVALAKVRTTQPLFTEPFKTGETSARIDRIASARASDLRDNRFAKWGVR